MRALPQQRKFALNMFYVCLFYEMVMLPLTSRIWERNFLKLWYFQYSCINPVIYCWRLGEICAAVKIHCRNSYIANDHVLRKVGAQNWQLPLGEKMSCILARKHYFNPQLKLCLHNRRQLISTASSVSGQFYRRIFVYKNWKGYCKTGCTVCSQLVCIHPTCVSRIINDFNILSQWLSSQSPGDAAVVNLLNYCLYSVKSHRT